MVEKIDRDDVRVNTLMGLGTDATRDQIASLLEKHNGHLDNVAVALLEGNFNADAAMPESDERGRQTTKSIAPALPPRRKNPSPVDNSMALVRTDQSNNPPAYDEDADLSKALALSMDDQGPPPLEPIPYDERPVYGPVQDPSKSDNRALDSGTDHALRRALEASLNDGRNSLAADVYVDLPIEERVRVNDGRPTALRSSNQNSIFAPPVFQALLAIPQLLARLKRSPYLDHEDLDEGIRRMLQGSKNDCALTRGMFTHAELTQEAYLDITPWGGESLDTTAQSPATLASDFIRGLIRGLNLSLPSSDRPLFLSTLHNPDSASPPPALPFQPHQEITQPHQDTLLYVIPLAMGVMPTSSTTAKSTPTPENLIDLLEYQVASERVGFASVPEALVFRVDRSGADAGKGKFGFPARMYFDRWMVEKRAFVEGEVKRREEEIEKIVGKMEEERVKLTKFEGRDTLADLKVCVKHFEENASDGGDEKRKARNERTLEQLKSVLKSIEDRCTEIKTKTESLKAERAELWDQPKLKTIPYDLRAVIIHDGLFGRAHIFSYVRRADKWWKVVDASVTEVSEETVLNDSAGVHLGGGAFILAYSLAEEKAEGDAGEVAKWPRKHRVKTQNANASFRSRLPPEIQSRLEAAEQPVSEGESDEDGASDDFMDAEELIVVAGAGTGEEVVDEVREIIPEDVSMDGASSTH